MAKRSSSCSFSTSSLHDVCLSKLTEQFDHYSPEMLSLLPPVQRKELLLLCPVVSVCHLEQTCVFDGIDSDKFWDELLKRHDGRLGSFRNYDINAHEVLRVSHSSNREKYFAFLTAMIFSGDRFSGHYAYFTNETGYGKDFYEEGLTPSMKERSCPDDIVNYLVAYQKPNVVEEIVKKVDTKEPVSQRNIFKEEEESDEEEERIYAENDDEFCYPLPARDMFGRKCGELYKEATKGQHVHSRYSHYILKENHYRLSDEDAVSLMMNECHYYPKKLFIHEYDRMHWTWSSNNLIRLLTQFFSKLESLSLEVRTGKDIDHYIETGSDFKEALELVYTCCFSSPVLASLVVVDSSRGNTASLALFSTLVANPCPSLEILDIHYWIQYSSGTAYSLELLANIIASHSQLTEIRLRLDTGLDDASSSFSCLYTALIDFVQKQEFTKLTLHGLVHISSQLSLLLDAFLKTPCSQPQQINLTFLEPACNEATPIQLPVGDYKVPSGALEYKSLFIDEYSKVTVDCCEWLFSHQPLILKAFHFEGSLVSVGEYHELVPSETAFPVHYLSDNASFQIRELSLPIFDDFLNQALQNLLHRQQLTKLSLRPTVQEPKPCNINAITRILSLQKETLTELMISREYFNYTSIESSTDMECFGDALFSLRNIESFSLNIAIIWKKEDTSYIDSLYKSWLKHGCKKMKSFQMGNFEYQFALTDELARKIDKIGLVILTW